MLRTEAKCHCVVALVLVCAFIITIIVYIYRFVACKIVSVILLIMIYTEAASVPDKFRGQESMYLDHMREMEQSPPNTVICSFNVSMLFFNTK